MEYWGKKRIGFQDVFRMVHLDFVDLFLVRCLDSEDVDILIRHFAIRFNDKNDKNDKQIKDDELRDTHF